LSINEHRPICFDITEETLRVIGEKRKQNQLNVQSKDTSNLSDRFLLLKQLTVDQIKDQCQQQNIHLSKFRNKDALIQHLVCEEYC
jgi:hypothetical protein